MDGSILLTGVRFTCSTFPEKSDVKKWAASPRKNRKISFTILILPTRTKQQPHPVAVVEWSQVHFTFTVLTNWSKNGTYEMLFLTEEVPHFCSVPLWAALPPRAAVRAGQTNQTALSDQTNQPACSDHAKTWLSRVLKSGFWVEQVTPGNAGHSLVYLRMHSSPKSWFLPVWTHIPSTKEMRT